ncbi:hypothetical protein SEA_NHAGOS_44 [Gordonia phage NHagos]|nr:hypothetical protein SEA_NHAGOS_44 [Gordonia phage NHagos]
MASPFDKKSGSTATATKAKAKPEAGDGFDTAAEGGDVQRGKAGDPFSLPPTPAEINVSDLVGTLVLCKPTEIIESMETTSGLAENVVRADVVALDGDLEGDYEDVLFFQTALKRALAKVFDGPNPYLLGRIEMGTAKKGKNAPYLFGKPDEDDMNVARAYLAK